MPHYMYLVSSDCNFVKWYFSLGDIIELWPSKIEY